MLMDEDMCGKSRRKTLDTLETLKGAPGMDKGGERRCAPVFGDRRWWTEESDTFSRGNIDHPLMKLFRKVFTRYVGEWLKYSTFIQCTAVGVCTYKRM